MRKKIIGICLIAISSGCNPYQTRMINYLSKKNKIDSIAVMPPAIVSRIQYDKNEGSYRQDNGEAFHLAKNLTAKAMRSLFDGYSSIYYGDTSQVSSYESKVLLDSVLERFLNKKYQHFNINQNLRRVSVSRYILIPYLIWTRTTDDYDDGTCGYNPGRNYFLGRYCTWTKAQAHLILIDVKKREVVYFKYNQWDRGEVWMPYEQRVTRSFKRCAQPLLNKLRKRK